MFTGVGVCLSINLSLINKKNGAIILTVISYMTKVILMNIEYVRLLRRRLTVLFYGLIRQLFVKVVIAPYYKFILGISKHRAVDYLFYRWRRLWL